MGTISPLDDEVIELIVAGQLSRADRYIFENQLHINMPYILSFIIHRSLYLEAINGLPVSVNRQLVELAERVATLRMDNEEEIRYAITNNDMSIPVFLLDRRIIDINQMHDMMSAIPGGREAMTYIARVYI